MREAGSRAWALNAERARKIPYLVCTQNLHHPDRDFREASANHGAAFLVGKISDIIPCVIDRRPNRWKICISEYAYCNVPDAWGGYQNPVSYTTLEELGVNLPSLNFHKVPEQQDVDEDAVQTREEDSSPLSIAQAKPRLAAYYEVGQDAIEIVIRG